MRLANILYNVLMSYSSLTLLTSWSGNLVTNISWEHFWLNEGFTVYIERRILARTESEEYAEFHALLGLNDLKEGVDDLKEKGKYAYTALIPNLKNGVDPDDAFRFEKNANWY
jgi:leukotriene-A4 hydrolase